MRQLAWGNISDAFLSAAESYRARRAATLDGLRRSADLALDVGTLCKPVFDPARSAFASAPLFATCRSKVVSKYFSSLGLWGFRCGL